MALLKNGTRIYGFGTVDGLLTVGSIATSNASPLVISSAITRSSSNTTGTIVITNGGGLATRGNIYSGNIVITGAVNSNGITFTDGTRQTRSGLEKGNTLTQTVVGPVIFSDNDPSTSNTTGALIITGGVGVSGNIYVGGTNDGANGIYTDNLRYAANGLPWVMNSGGGGSFSGGTIPNQLIIANNTAAISNTTGALQVQGGVGVTGNVYVSGVLVANSVFVSNGIEIVTSVLANNVVTPSPSVVLNDITNQFDNLKCVFNLTSEQSNVVNIMNSRNLEVIINGAKLAPYVTELRYPWLTPYDSFKGHRVVSSNTSSQVVIYNPPAPGEQAILTLINNSSSPQNRRYPYSAATIALGD